MGSSVRKPDGGIQKKFGLPVNPRIEYQNELSKNINKPRLVDAPVLVKLQHGSIRYRYDENNYAEIDSNRTEKPHEGDSRIGKEGYFFHSRLRNYNPLGSKEKEDACKFCYVYKGPSTAKGKKVHYVFAKGLQKVSDSDDRTIIYDYRKADHVYYIMTFIPQTKELDEIDHDQEIYNDDIESHYKEDIIVLKMDKKQTIDRVKRRLAVRVIKPLGNIHIYLREVEEELKSEVRISDILPIELRKFQRICVELTQK